MPETPWISPFKINPEPETDYIIQITYLPLRSYLDFPTFFKDVQKVQDQLQKSHGLIGFKLRADILAKQGYTISVWENAESLKKFISSGAHKETMDQSRDYLGEGRKFVTAFIKGSDFPPSWEWAIKMLKEN
ncbi:hypothetical protein [Ruegeria sp.]|uniref:hypothetical protein n=1 Tax=Ruegeria sp. TaxID=1879320 RepID=UPI002318B668|nr:hypothetical protein [Ruegeria sp.]MDA7967305.1 hypothetical protein [Ruegeria sp.]